MYVVSVDFFVKPAHREAFIPQMVANATASLAEEPGCSQFDVAIAQDDPCHIYLYEVYDDRAAFDAHLATAHFRQFNETTADWVQDKRVATFKRIAP